MKTFAFVLGILMLFSQAFAATYTTEYVADNWLKVTRVVLVRDSSTCLGEGVTDACANTGAVQIGGSKTGVSTSVSITAENLGAIERQNIILSESLSYVPTGAKLIFNPTPSSFDGQTASWGIPSLGSRRSAIVTYAFSARTEEGQAARIPDVSVQAETTVVVLSAPSYSAVGDEVQLSLKATDGTPVPGARLSISYPDGATRYVKTNSRGTASFIASQGGFYTYSAEGYAVSGLVSTEAQPEEFSGVSAAAITSDKGVVGSLFGILPILLAIFIVAVVVLILYNFLTQRREEGIHTEPAPQPAAAQTYSQKFSFGGPQPEAPEKKVTVESTRDLIEARKRHIRESQETFLSAGTAPSGSSSSTPASDATIYDEGERGASALEAAARNEGEVAKEETEIEKTIAELEAIRAKLRSRRAEVSETEEEAGTEAESGEEESAGEPLEKESESSEEEAPSEEEPGEAEEAEEPSEEEAAGGELVAEETTEEEMEEPEEKPARKLVSKAKPSLRKTVYEKRAAPAKKKAAPRKKFKFGSKGVKKR